MSSVSRRAGLWFGARFIGCMADQVILFAVPTIVYERTGSIGATGLAFAIEWIPRLASLLFWGRLVDRWGSGRTYLLADAARLGIAAIAALPLMVPASTTPLLFGIIGGLSGMFFEASFVAFEVILVRVAPHGRVGHYQSHSQSLEQLSLIAGPGLAALLVGTLGASRLFLVAALAFGLSAGLALAARWGSGQEASPEAQEGTSGFREGIGLLLQMPQLVWLTVTGFCLNFAVSTALAVTPGYSQAVLKADRSAFGYLNMGAGVLGALLFLVLPRLSQRVGFHRLGLAAPLLATAGCILMARAAGLGLYAPGYVLLLCSDGVLALFIRKLRADLVPREQLGIVTSAMALMLLAAFPLGGLTASLASYLPDPSVLHLVAALSGVVVLVASRTAWRTATRSPVTEGVSQGAPGQG